MSMRSSIQIKGRRDSARLLTHFIAGVEDHLVSQAFIQSSKGLQGCSRRRGIARRRINVTRLDDLGREASALPKRRHLLCNKFAIMTTVNAVLRKIETEIVGTPAKKNFCDGLQAGDVGRSHKHHSPRPEHPMRLQENLERVNRQVLQYFHEQYDVVALRFYRPCTRLDVAGRAQEVNRGTDRNAVVTNFVWLSRR